MPSAAFRRSHNIVQHDRGLAYNTARSGRRFTVSHQSIGTTVVAQTSFAATTPTFLIYHTGGLQKLILSSLSLSQVSPVAGGPINVLIATDRVSRFSAGGTAVVPLPTFNSGDTGDSAAADRSPDFTFVYNPTATVAQTKTRYAYKFIITQNVTSPVPLALDFEDGLIAGKVGSISIYVWAATTAPTLEFSFDIIEEV